MPRMPRLQFPDAIYHVTCCGVRKSDVFRGLDDRSDFLSMLGVVVARREWRCLSYCLMTTHYHLLVQTPNGDIAAGMQLLNGSYAQTFNRRHGVTGHVFERRYDAKLVQTEAHLFAVYRYIALNPVRAGICSDPADWEWSSFAATIGLKPPPEFLATEDVMLHFGPPRETAEARLAAFVRGVPFP